MNEQRKLDKILKSTSGEQPIETKSNFVYAGYSSELIIRSTERKARIKANEEVATKAFLEIAVDVKGQHDDLGDYQTWLSWCEVELGYKRAMAQKLLQMGKELGSHVSLKNLPISFRGLNAIASSLSKLEEPEKEKFLTEYEEQAEIKSKPLTEKEIKSLPLVKEIMEQLNDYKTATEILEKDNGQLRLSIEDNTQLRKLYNSIYEEKQLLEKTLVETKHNFEKEKRKVLQEYSKSNLTKQERKKDELTLKLREIESEISSKQVSLRLIQSQLSPVSEEMILVKVRTLLNNLHQLTASLDKDTRCFLQHPTDEVRAEYSKLADTLRYWADLFDSRGVQASESTNSKSPHLKIISLDQ
jgi:hypothetical protein